MAESVFLNYEYKKLRDLVPELTDDQKANVDYRDGDHWQHGDGWIGQQPLDEHGNVDQTAMEEIERGFISANVTGEFIDNHVAGVLGNEPDWGLFSTNPTEVDEEEAEETEEDIFIANTEASLVQWWDDQQALIRMQEAVSDARTVGYGYLRWFVLEGFYNPETGGTRKANTLDEALKKIQLERPAVDQTFIYTDPTTRQSISVHIYTNSDRKEVAEVAFVDADPDGTNQTIFRRIDNTGTDDKPIPLGGYLPIFQMQLKPLVTEQTKKNNALLNEALTMLGRNVVVAGFLERIFSNIQPPLEDLVDEETGEVTQVPSDLPIGAGRTTLIQGAKITDKDGNDTLLTPGVHFRDPVEVASFENTIRIAYYTIMKEVKQLHTLITGDAGLSGESRKQARAVFANSLKPTKAQVDAMGRWLLGSVLNMAAYLMGQPTLFSELRPYFDSQIDTGPLSSDELRELREESKDGFRSVETTMIALGVQDPDAEKERIARESILAMSPQARADYVNTILALIDEEEALRLLGYTEERIAEMQARKQAASGSVDSIDDLLAADTETQGGQGAIA